MKWLIANHSCAPPTFYQQEAPLLTVGQVLEMEYAGTGSEYSP